MKTPRIESSFEMTKHSNGVLFDRSNGLPLSKKALLASNALAISNLLELINEIESKREKAKNIDINQVNIGISVITDLKKGEDYLLERKTSLIQRPESTDTVRYIRSRTGSQINDKSDMVLGVLEALKAWPEFPEKLDIEELRNAKNFLRDVYTGIVDQLETSDENDLEL